MRLIPMLLPACLFAQAGSPAADLRRDSLSKCAAAPIAGILTGADEWLQTYESSGPDPHARPPYLTLARFYALKGIRTEEIPTLDKAVRELSAPGSYTQSRTHGNSPFEDDIERALAANAYTQIRLYDQAGGLLARTGQTVDRTNAAELDMGKGRIFEALRFQYWDGMTRLAIAQGRKDDALTWEHAILTNPNNVASSSLIEQHRQTAQQLWKELGRSDDFQKWLSGTE
jgi:hypothetical protein